MGNTSSQGPEIKGDKTPTTDIVQKDQKDRPYTFGPELELVVKPYLDKIADEIPGAKDVLDKTRPANSYTEKEKVSDVDLRGEREKWSTIVTMVLQHCLGDREFSVLWANNPAAKALKEKGTYYRCWSVIEDSTIDCDLMAGEWTVEIVSRVQYAAKDQWLEEFSDIWSILYNFFEIRTRDRGSTHVHVKRLPPSMKKANETRALFAKSVAKYVVFWEPCVRLLSPNRRRNTYFCASNLTASKNLFTVLQKEQAKGAKYKTIFDMIDNPSQIEGLILQTGKNEGDLEIIALTSLLCGDNKDVAWNFQYLWQTKSNPKPSGTIEYRRFHGSNTAHDACQAAALTLCFVHGALKNDPEVYKMMCQTDLVFTNSSYVVSTKNPPFPPEFDAFGQTHFADFIKWMRKAALELGLEDYLINEQSNE